MKKFSFAWLALGVAVSAGAKTYEIDADHSSVAFRVGHLGGKVGGRFDRFAGRFDYDPADPKAWKAEAEIDAASVNTNNANRDKHLRAADFFDADKCPKISFQTEKVSELKGGRGKLHGRLTMRCKTQPVVLELELGSEMKDPWGNVKMSATATGKIDRKDFGIVWNKALDAGGVVVGEQVDLTIDVEGAVKKEAAAKN